MVIENGGDVGARGVQPRRRIARGRHRRRPGRGRRRGRRRGNDRLPRVVGNEGTAARLGDGRRTDDGCCSSRGSAGRRACRSTPPGRRRRLGERVRPGPARTTTSVTWCGRRLALSGGGDGRTERRATRSSCRVRRTGGTRTCPTTSPAAGSGRRAHRTASGSSRRPPRTVPEAPPGRGIRALWMLATDGTSRSRLTGAGNAAYEAARWSADGRFILVVRRGIEPDSPGALLLSVSIRPPARRRAPGPGRADRRRSG